MKSFHIGTGAPFPRLAGSVSAYQGGDPPQAQAGAAISTVAHDQMISRAAPAHEAASRDEGPIACIKVPLSC